MSVDTMCSDIQNKLFTLSDTGYRDFQARLVPSVDKRRVIGVRVPVLRKLARDMRSTDAARAFMGSLKHEYYDEDNLHALLINQIDDFNDCVRALDAFLPYVDNWMTCDIMAPQALAREPDALISRVCAWINGAHTYTIRFGIVIMMRHFLGEWFSPEYMRMVADVRSDEYYVNMAAAWYFATAIAKRPREAIEYITAERLDPFTRAKAIQKALESYRVSDEIKHTLRVIRHAADEEHRDITRTT